jgi:hypothetical protein
MEFDFEYNINEEEGFWSVTDYYGRTEKVIFPASYKGIPVKKIGDAFSINNRKIKKVIIPEGFTAIGKKSFQNCAGLTNIKFPESLISIQAFAFQGCTGLKKIKLPESLTSIGVFAFQGCAGLTDIKFPESLISIGAYAFQGCTGLTAIKVPENLTSIGANVFHDCTGLTHIELPDGLTSIEDWAFGNCTGLANIKVPRSLTSINGWAFFGCLGLAEITVDENNPAFCALDGVMFDKNMTDLVWFPDGKKGRYSIPEGVKRMTSHAFFVCNLTSISFPQSLLSIESDGFNGEQLKDITVSELNPNYCSIDGVLFDKEGKELLIYPKNWDKTDYTVPDGVQLITNFAFYGCRRLTNINFPESLELIGNYAFAECEGLKAVTLPMNLRYVQDSAFANCQNLKTITLSKKTKILGSCSKIFDGFSGQLIYME